MTASGSSRWRTSCWVMVEAPRGVAGQRVDGGRRRCPAGRSRCWSRTSGPRRPSSRRRGSGGMSSHVDDLAALAALREARQDRLAVAVVDDRFRAEADRSRARSAGSRSRLNDERASDRGHEARRPRRAPSPRRSETRMPAGTSAGGREGAGAGPVAGRRVLVVAAGASGSALPARLSSRTGRRGGRAAARRSRGRLGAALVARDAGRGRGRAGHAGAGCRAPVATARGRGLHRRPTLASDRGPTSRRDQGDRPRPRSRRGYHEGMSTQSYPRGSARP